MEGMAGTLSRNGPRKQIPIKPDPFGEGISLRGTHGRVH
jgi:hypothetical protein